MRRLHLLSHTYTTHIVCVTLCRRCHDILRTYYAIVPWGWITFTFLQHTHCIFRAFLTAQFGLCTAWRGTLTRLLTYTAPSSMIVRTNVAFICSYTCCVCVDWNYDQHSFTISAWQHVQGINSAPTIFELPILRLWAIYTVTTPPTPQVLNLIRIFYENRQNSDSTCAEITVFVEYVKMESSDDSRNLIRPT